MKGSLTNFARARFMLSVSTRRGRDERIEDGYVVWRGDEILEVGAYDAEVGVRLLSEHRQLDVLGGGEAREPEQLIQHDGVLLPGFVKAHGHDHESPIIGMVKDVPLTAWLDGAVNVFTGFLEEHHETLTKKLGESPHFLTYLKAKVADHKQKIGTLKGTGANR